MGYQTGIVTALRDWGLTVVEAPGWQTRGSSSFYPHGHVVHHDVIGHTETLPSIMVSGRPDLSGPLCNFWLPRSGKVHLVAAGRANHAGSGGWNGLSGNSSVWGTEMNNTGYPSDPWPDAQIEAMARLAAATAEFSGFPAGNVCGHKEWAPTRKIDPHSINMGLFRLQVANQHRGRPLTPEDRRRLTALAAAEAEHRPTLAVTRPVTRGRDVRDVQAILGAPVTGRYGRGVEKRVKAFQGFVMRAEPSGVVDRATWQALLFAAAARYLGFRL